MKRAVLVIGGLSGIGYATMKQLLEEYAPDNLYTTTRKVDNESIKTLKNLGLEAKNVFSLDLSSLNSTKDFLALFKKSCDGLSGLVLNAAHIETSSALMTTTENIHTHMSINFSNQIFL